MSTKLTTNHFVLCQFNFLWLKLAFHNTHNLNHLMHQITWKKGTWKNLRCPGDAKWNCSDAKWLASNPRTRMNSFDNCNWASTCWMTPFKTIDKLLTFTTRGQLSIPNIMPVIEERKKIGAFWPKRVKIRSELPLPEIGFTVYIWMWISRLVRCAENESGRAGV